MSFRYPCICIDSADRCLEKYVKRLLGKTDIEDALKRLDKLTQEEARMATAQLLTLTHGVDETVRVVHDGARCVIFSYSFLREPLHDQTEKKQSQSYSRQQEKRQQLCNLWRTRSTKSRVRGPVTLTISTS